MVKVWQILHYYDKASEIVRLSIDLVEEYEGKKVPVYWEGSGFVNEERWKKAHERYIGNKKIVGTSDAAHMVTNDGKHVILFREKKFKELMSRVNQLQWKINLLHVTVHECLHLLGYRDDKEVERRTDEILRKIMNVGHP